MTSEIHELFKQCRRPSAKHDTYFVVYDELFAPYKGKDVTFVEIGISGGGSLEVWRKYFGKGSRIIGIDLNPALQEELKKDGFDVFIGDQADPAFWRSFYAQVGNVDILLDDGGHTNTQTWTTLTQSLDHINDGGLLVIEDTHTSYKRSFGNPSSSSLIARLFACVDQIQYRSSEIDDLDRRGRSREHAKLLREVDITKKVHSIRFYESIVALSVDSRKCAQSQRTRFGSADSLPRGEHPEDFRHRGIRESLAHRLRGRARRLLDKLPRL
jgi:hypothetical protein